MNQRIDIETPAAPWRPYRTQLATPRQRDAYDACVEGLLARRTRIALPEGAFTPAQARILVRNLQRDLPEADCRHLSVVGRGGLGHERPVALETHYEEDDARARADLAHMEAIARDIIAGMPRIVRTRDHLRALYLHDWLAAHCTYGDAPHAHRAQGALLDRHAVCDGIAGAYKFLCDRVGVPCAFVGGTWRGGEPHAWNLVYAAGRWSHVDVTNDLMGCNCELDGHDRAGRTVSHAFLGLSDAKILEVCAIDTPEPGDIAPPKAPTPDGLGYYESLGLRADTPARLVDTLVRAWGRGVENVEVKLGNALAGDEPALRRAVHEAARRHMGADVAFSVNFAQRSRRVYRFEAPRR